MEPNLDIRYARTIDGAFIACAVLGQGPLVHDGRLPYRVVT